MEKIKKLIKKFHLANWVIGGLLFIIGLMFLLNNIGELATNLDLYMFTTRFISIFLGILFIVIGIALIAYAFITKKDLLNLPGLIGGFILAFGIYSIVGNATSTLFLLIIYAFPFAMVVIGGVILVDAIFDLAIGLKANSISKLCICELIASVVLLLLGILILAIPALNDIQVLLSGIVIMAIGVVVILDIFLSLSGKIIAIKNTLSDTIDMKKEEQNETKKESATEEAATEEPATEEPNDK